MPQCGNVNFLTVLPDEAFSIRDVQFHDPGVRVLAMPSVKVIRKFMFVINVFRTR